MIRKVLQTASEMGACTEIVLLREKTIAFCDGCLSCEAGGSHRQGVCRTKDDMQELYPKLLEADAIVFGTPVYFELLSAMLKNFLDRTCPIWPRLKGKMAAAVAVAEEGIGKAIDNIETYCSLCGIKSVGSVTALAKHPDDVSQDEQAARKLAALGRQVVHALGKRAV